MKFLEEILDMFRSRVKNVFYSTFAISLVLLNWKFFFILIFSELSPIERLKYLRSEVLPNNDILKNLLGSEVLLEHYILRDFLLIPLGLSVIHIFGLSYASEFVYRFWLKHVNKMSDAKKEAEGSQLLTVEEARKIRIKNGELKSKIGDMEKEHIKELEALREENQKIIKESSERISNLEKELATYRDKKHQRDLEAHGLSQTSETAGSVEHIEISEEVKVSNSDSDADEVEKPFIEDILERMMEKLLHGNPSAWKRSPEAEGFLRGRLFGDIIDSHYRGKSSVRFKNIFDRQGSKLLERAFSRDGFRFISDPRKIGGYHTIEWRRSHFQEQEREVGEDGNISGEPPMKNPEVKKLDSKEDVGDFQEKEERYKVEYASIEDSGIEFYFYNNGGNPIVYKEIYAIKNGLPKKHSPTSSYNKTETYHFYCADDDQCGLYIKNIRGGTRVTVRDVESNNMGSLVEKGKIKMPESNFEISPILDNENRAYFYGNNVRCNNVDDEPYHFRFGQELKLKNFDGYVQNIRILHGLRKGWFLIEYEKLSGRIEG